MKIPQIKITYSHVVPVSQLPKLSSIIEVVHECKKLYDLETIEYRETFHLLLMNKALRYLGSSIIGEGGRDSCPVDIAQIAQIALKANANNVVITHNHPSGSRQPSETDIRLTKRLKDALALLNIEVIDHIIVTLDNGCFSFANEGIL